MIGQTYVVRLNDDDGEVQSKKGQFSMAQYDMVELKNLIWQISSLSLGNFHVQVWAVV